MQRKTYRTLTVLCSLMAGLILSPYVALAVDLPKSGPPSQPAPQQQGAGGTRQTFANLQSIWESAYKLQNSALDLSNEGKFWDPHASWLDYYSSTIGQLVPVLQDEVASANFPPDKQGLIAEPWSAIQASVSDIAAQYDKLKAAIAEVEAELQKGGHSKYPPPYWDEARAIEAGAKKIDTLLLSIYDKITPGADSTAAVADQNAISQADISSFREVAAAYAAKPKEGSATQAQGTTDSGTLLTGKATVLQAHVGVKAISDASKRIEDAANGVINELERWNLFYGQPPPGGPGTLPYGGGLTPDEITTQYRYLPQFAFTMPSYVRFSYRLPPRHKVLSAYTTQMGKLINLMASEIADTQIPSDREPALAGPWNALQDVYKDTIAQYMQLLNLINTTDDNKLKKNIREDETEFGKYAVAIYGDMQKMQGLVADLNQIAKQ